MNTSRTQETLLFVFVHPPEVCEESTQVNIVAIQFALGALNLFASWTKMIYLIGTPFHNGYVLFRAAGDYK